MLNTQKVIIMKKNNLKMKIKTIFQITVKIIKIIKNKKNKVQIMTVA